MIALWAGFVIFVLIMLALDLGVLNRKARVIDTREALTWTGVCIGLALLFNVFIHFLYHYRWFGIGSGNGLVDDGVHLGDDGVSQILGRPDVHQLGVRHGDRVGGGVVRQVDLAELGADEVDAWHQAAASWRASQSRKRTSPMIAPSPGFSVVSST